jgi:hypothetical protein
MSEAVHTPIVGWGGGGSAPRLPVLRFGWTFEGGYTEAADTPVVMRSPCPHTQHQLTASDWQWPLDLTFWQTQPKFNANTELVHQVGEYIQCNRIGAGGEPGAIFRMHMLFEGRRALNFSLSSDFEGTEEYPVGAMANVHVCVWRNGRPVELLFEDGVTGTGMLLVHAPTYPGLYKRTGQVLVPYYRYNVEVSMTALTGRCTWVRLNYWFS